MDYDFTDLAYPYELPPGLDKDRLPGKLIAPKLQELVTDDKKLRMFANKIEHSCRKVCTMCLAQHRTLEAERNFYSLTVKEAPALFGEDAVEIAYHLEAFILFSRSSLDVVSKIFSHILLDGQETDSFNSLTESIVQKSKNEHGGLSEKFLSYVSVYSIDSSGWFPILCGSQRGRALRDKIAHQTGLPISYAEYSTGSEKERPFVKLSKDLKLPLEKFMMLVRDGVIENFIAFEEECLRYKLGLEI